VKPGAMSRGRRISVYSNLTEIKDLIGPDLNIIASGWFSLMMIGLKFNR